MKKQIRAVLFDCDGVIIDSAADISDAVNKTLKAYKLKTLSQEKLKSFVGNGAAVLIERSLRESLSLKANDPLPFTAEQIKEITSLYLKNYYAAATVKTKLYPGLEDALKALKGAGIRLGIVTNKPSKILKEILRHFGIAEYFDAPVGAGQVKNLKPAPDGIFLALEKINSKIQKEINLKEKNTAQAQEKTCFIPVGADETIMVGDGWTDISAGHAAKTLTAACLKGMGDSRKTLAQNPDIVLGYAAEIAGAVLLANKIISR